MDRIVLFVVLSGSWRAAGEPLAAALRRRSEAFTVYASAFGGEYEPVAFAAVPLHAPLPVLHLVASAPPPWRHRRPPAPRPPYDRLAAPSDAHLSRVPAPLYVQPSPAAYGPRMVSPYGRHPQIYAASLAYPMYSVDSEPAEPQPSSEEPPTVLYARPRPQGGYSYRRRPAAKRKVPSKQEPVVIRIHKYKVKGR